MWTWEAKEGKAVIVVVHGAGEHHGRYEWLRSQWIENGYHVVMGDLPGQGATRGKRGHIRSFDVYIEAIESWVHYGEQYGVPIILFGHSMGGLAVIRTVTEKDLPIKAIMLSSPCLGIVHKPSLPIDAVARLLNKVYPSLRLSADQGLGNATRSEEMLKRDEEDDLLVKKVSVRWYRELLTAMKIAQQTTDRFPDVPLALVQSGNDMIVDKRKVREWFNKLQLIDKAYKEWPDLYHEVLNEPERDSVFRYLNRFVEYTLEFY